MDLPRLSGLFMLFALTMYVVLDGFDLGVGVLLLAQRDERVRDRMVDAIAPTWDGNETWLIMAGVTLLSGFPIAYGILLPALYIPVILMLLSLGLRGVSFEFRHNGKTLRRRWDVVFAGGSVVAGLAQGIIVGGLLQGVNVNQNAFAGSPLDTFSSFSILIGVTVMAGYATLGAGWLRLKGEDATRAFARTHQQWIPLVFLGLTAIVTLIGATVQPSLRAVWRDHRAALSSCLFVFAACGLGIAWLARRDEIDDSVGFGLALAMMLSGMVALGLSFFPNVVPFRISLWSAASSPASHEFVLIGALVVAPVVLAYTGFAYWVFHGKTPADGWY
jgi:cytochrome bd ubiquinol oxidase subunit II